VKFIFLLFVLLSTNAIFGQRTAVDRNTGRIISCEELGCNGAASDYENADRSCLNCMMRLSDSTMQVEKNKILGKCQKSKNGCKSFIEEQEQWELNCEKIATKESNKYQGGTMEITEYVRTKLIQTNKRIAYLRNYILTFEIP